jgi:beta-N-acetylhexosaminidase
LSVERKHIRAPDDKPLPVIFGIAGTEVNALERSLFESCNPFGFILFKRNCATPEQVHWLIKELRQVVGREDVPAFIDQEGGRVLRLGPPHWPKLPPARLFGLIYEHDAELGAEAMRHYARIVANDLAKLGFTVNCAPVLDLFLGSANGPIGDRAFSAAPSVAAALGRRMAEGLMENGILPVIKHLPGHGRLKTDPHDMLPAIEASAAELESEDFTPFELLKDVPLGMTSHAIFTALDPLYPASLSQTIHRDIIRGRMGFDGLLLSDDICMKALHGTPDDLARRALAAGSDIVLHCNGKYEEMQAIAHVLKPIGAESWARWLYAQSIVRPAKPDYSPAEDNERLDILLGAMAYEEKSTG